MSDRPDVEAGGRESLFDDLRSGGINTRTKNGLFSGLSSRLAVLRPGDLTNRSGQTVVDHCCVYIVASKPITDDCPKGDCLACGKPLRDHEKRVSKLAPPGIGYAINEAMLRV